MYTERNRLPCRYCSNYAESHESITTKRNDRKLADFINITQLSLQRKNANPATEIQKIDKEKTLKRELSLSKVFSSFFYFYSFYTLFLICELSMLSRIIHKKSCFISQKPLDVLQSASSLDYYSFIYELPVLFYTETRTCFFQLIYLIRN